MLFHQEISFPIATMGVPQPREKSCPRQMADPEYLCP
jgi:hypothetical protein